MNKNIYTIGIKINRQRLEALYEMHTGMISRFVPESQHDHLLHAHLTCMYWKIEKMLENKNFKNTTLLVTSAEALAFCLLWGEWNLDYYLPGKVVVLDLIGKIDREVKQPKFLN